MVIDCHYHLEESMLPLEEFFRKMGENGVDRIALMGKPFPIIKDPDNEPVFQMVTHYPDRCLFGTDGPYGFHGRDGRYDYGFIKKRIERLFPDSGVQRRIFGENFAELAGL